MAFDFPNSPSEGTIFSPPGGPTYVFQSPVWKAVGQGQIAIISDTAPANPANGTLWFESDTGILFIYMNDGNSSQWVQAGGIAAAGAMVTTIVLPSSGTYTKPAGLRFLEVTCVGGGGGGASAVATTASQSSAGGGGGAGGTCQSFYRASDLAATTAYTVGAQGLGQVSPTAGGSTTFGGMTANGGGAAAANGTGAVTAWTRGSGGGGGGATGGNVMNVRGGRGGMGIAFFTSVGNAQNGIGGSSLFSTVEGSIYTAAATAGTAASGWGGGGGGASNAITQTTTAGGAGSDGVVILKEYF